MECIMHNMFILRGRVVYVITLVIELRSRRKYEPSVEEQQRLAACIRSGSSGSFCCLLQ
jgi:hypothetical protein